MLRNRPVVAVMSVLAAFQIIAGAANLAGLVGARPAAWIVLLVAAAQAGVQFWVQAQVTPLTDPRDSSGAPLRRSGLLGGG